MRSVLRPLVLASLLLAGCGSPAPLMPDPGYQPQFGPAVQLHAQRENGALVIDGVAQGVTTLQAALIHGGRVVSQQPVPISQQMFHVSIPVQDGDQVNLTGDNGYAEGFMMSWPNRVTQSDASQSPSNSGQPTAAAMALSPRYGYPQPTARIRGY